MRRRIATGLGDGQADYSSSIMPLLPSLSVVSNEAMDTTGTLSLLIEPTPLSSQFLSLSFFVTLFFALAPCPFAINILRGRPKAASSVCVRAYVLMCVRVCMGDRHKPESSDFQINEQCK